MILKDLVVGKNATSQQEPKQQAPKQQAPKQQAPKQQAPKKEEPKQPKKPLRLEKPQPTKVEKQAQAQDKNLFVQDFSRELKKAELWFGDPGTGKTTLARRLFEGFKEGGQIDDYMVVNAQEELTVMSLFKTTKTDEDGNWKFIHNEFFKMLTDNSQATYGVIIDEFNTMPMSVMKSLQPIIDDTEGDFVFEDKMYQKNPNIYFIFTLNHNDMGISELPIAIKDRLYPNFFEPLSDEKLAKRSGVDKKVIEKLRKVRQMFSHLGDLPEFHKSVRQLKQLQGANGQQVKDYIIAQLALANIEYEEAINMSAEFEDLLEEFDKLLNGGE